MSNQILQQLNKIKFYLDHKLTADAEKLLFRMQCSESTKYQINFFWGVVRSQQGRFKDAKVYFRKALRVKPQSADVHFNLGVIAKKIGSLESAIKAYKKAVLCDPYHELAWENLIYEYQSADKSGEIFNRVLKVVNRSSPEAMKVLLAKCYEGVARHSDEKDFLENCLADHPSSHELRYILSLACARASDGLVHKYYRSRWSVDWFLNTNQKFMLGPGFTWPEDLLPSMNILIQAEMGIGDEVMFLSCLPHFAKRFPNLTLNVDKRLRKTLENTFPDLFKLRCRLSPPDFKEQSSLAEFDAIVPLGAIAEGVSKKSVGWCDNKKLWVDQEKALRWKEMHEKDSRVIGIAWRGGGDNISRTRRSLKCIEMIGLVRDSSCKVINLQHDVTPEEDAELNKMLGERYYNPHGVDLKHDLAEVWALISTLDSVLTVDCAIAHFSGALRKPTWLLLPAASEWRWGAQDVNTPWYESVRLVRDGLSRARRMVLHLDNLELSKEGS